MKNSKIRLFKDDLPFRTMRDAINSLINFTI